MSAVIPITAPIQMVGKIRLRSLGKGCCEIMAGDDAGGKYLATGANWHDATAALIQAITADAIAEEARAWSEDRASEGAGVSSDPSDPLGEALCDLAAPVDTLRVVLEERLQQISQGYTADHDDVHDEGELILAACCYANVAILQHQGHQLPPCFWPKKWPWLREDFHPSPDVAGNVVKAAALLLAEIIRLQRRETRKEQA